MINKLFVYGTLAPGKPNEHILSDLTGSWQPAKVKGLLLEAGWGAEVGYPGVKLDGNGEDVDGLIFSSDDLDDYWEMLDKFEGDEYRRVLVSARLEDGSIQKVYVYELNGN